ncbi:MAG: helix-turn-helix transcriptional regulator [Bdellovibrionaceae bacterium]|nr:helix-turn-helix transcriptional regulator [Pseudobdellovibrionaceae bacterium]
MESHSSRLIFMELKKVMKERGLNYGQVAKATGRSESGFKKIMSANDCSLHRLESICGAIGLRLSDLILAAENRELLNVTFEPQIEDFFLRQREGFQLYWLLVYERRTLDQAQKIMRIEKKRLDSLVRTLDKLNLVKLLADDRIVVPTPRGVRWIGKSKFTISLYKKWAQLLVDRSLRELAEPDGRQKYFSIRYLQMSDSTWNDYLDSLEKVEVEFSNRATAEMRMKLHKLRHVRSLTIVDNGSWGEDDLRPI